jgi:hypothetical protein
VQDIAWAGQAHPALVMDNEHAPGSLYGRFP